MIANDPMLWRMIWKEYRAQRAFWLVIAGTAVALMPLFMWLLDVQDGRFAAPWVIALMLPTLFAFGSSSLVFASEKEDDTFNLLRIMAARTSRVFVGKIAVSLAGTAAMWITLLAVAKIATWGNALPTLGGRPMTANWPMTVSLTVQLLAWGFMLSLACRKVLTALCLTAVVSPLSVLLVFALISGPPSFPYDYAFLLLVPPLVALSYLLTSRIMSGQSWDFSWLTRKLSSNSKTAPARESTKLARLAAVRDTAPAWRRQFTRLIWIEFHTAATIGHILWLVGLLVLVFFPFFDTPASDPARPVFGAVFSGLLVGVWMFQADGGKRTRFLADHGLSPQVVWLSKQFVWGLLAVVASTPFLVGVAIANHEIVVFHRGMYSSVYHSEVPGATAITFVATMSCLAYAVGQFASMLIPRAITAGFVTFVAGTFLCLWTWFMVQMRVPLALSGAPVFVILLATTLGWSRHWLLEQATARSWLRLTLALVASAVAVWGAIGVCRVYEVPHPEFVDEIEPFREMQGRPITTDEAATASLYRQALSQIKQDAGTRSVTLEREMQTARAGGGIAPDLKRLWLDENRDALKLCLTATERPTCAFDDPSRSLNSPQRDDSQLELGRLVTLLLLSARELESEGKLDEALNRYVATLRLARHAAGRSIVVGWSWGMEIERMVSAWIPAWAAHPDQTADRINAGMQRIHQEVAQLPTLRDALLTQQYMIRHMLRDDWSQAISRNHPAQEARTRIWIRVVEACGPWERLRAERVLDLYDASQLNCVEMLGKALETPHADMQEWAEAAAAVPATPDIFQVSLTRRPLSTAGNGSSSSDFFNATGLAKNPRDRIPWNWLNTTPLLMEIIPPDHAYLWQLGLKRELGARVMALRLKLAAYKKTHGEFPDRIDFLRLGMDAIDPYTGSEFGYHPHGWQSPVIVVNGLEMTSERVEPGTPILWSAGPGNVRLFMGMAPSTELPERLGPQMLTAYPLAFPLP
jgi:hypothetical protein